MQKRYELCGTWQLCDNKGETYVGRVPGCVHTDLFSDRDIYYETNSKNCKFIEERHWKYSRSFEVNEIPGKPILVFEGLDTYCDIYLNRQKVGRADNMFIPHRFSVDGILTQGENLLEVCFYSASKAVEAKPPRPSAFTYDRIYTRRMQFTYGWDWVERFVTAGIYRPVSYCF